MAAGTVRVIETMHTVTKGWTKDDMMDAMLFLVVQIQELEKAEAAGGLQVAELPPVVSS